MLLITTNINGTDHYVSLDGHRLTHNWKALVAGLSPCKMKSSRGHGGYVKLSFGTIDFSPDLFGGDDWPPPQSINITVQYTSTNEGSAVTYFIGVAYLRKVTHEKVNYDLHGPAYTAEVASGTAYNDTLVNVMTTLATALGLSIDTSAARSTSPTVVYTTTRDRLAIDVADEMCAFYSHLFYVSGATLYLVDCLADNGSRTIGEHEFFPSDIDKDIPTAEVTDGTNPAFSAYTYGQTVSQAAYHDVAENIVAAFDDILTILNRDRAKLKLPLAGDLPVPGERINWIDTSMHLDSEAWIRAMSLSYDFVKDEVVVDGRGLLTKLNALLIEPSGDYLLAANGATISITRNREVSAAPTFSPPAGTLETYAWVTISAGPGATIYYTTDGTEPRTDSTEYSGPMYAPVYVGQTCTIRAIAIEPGKIRAEASATYVREGLEEANYTTTNSRFCVLTSPTYDGDDNMAWLNTPSYTVTCWALFTNVQIERYQTIYDAYLRVDSYGNFSGDVDVDLYFANVGNPTLPTNYAALHALDFTDAVRWEIREPWVSTNTYDTIDISSILQDVVNRSDWNSGNSVLAISKGYPTWAAYRMISLSYVGVSSWDKMRLHVAR